MAGSSHLAPAANREQAYDTTARYNHQQPATDLDTNQTAMACQVADTDGVPASKSLRR
jgi:hypothetical protein